METHLLYLFTRTPLHIGAGSSVGAIDQPIQRERHTGFPIIPGSSLKGVLRAAEQPQNEDSATVLFGKADDNGDSRSGIVAFAEGKLLLFPLRSAKGGFALATCPLALNRYLRDAGLDLPRISGPTNDSCCLAGPSVQLNGGKVALEEYVFQSEGEFPTDWATHLSGLLNDAVLQEAKGRFVLLTDGDFAHFAMNACQVSQHVAINHETGTAKPRALFNEETVPAEALFYSSVTLLPLKEEQDRPHLDAFCAKLEQERLLQLGGNNTAGLGFVTSKLQRAGGAA
ncbi:MAG: hypothetical protein E1N59_1116 [Puniceicoccaceae bacterium 5H]|nr:MAG: hypothetical protein E1N59_1116 [Puniceicoccaceae bacterium 5H]